MDEQERSLHHRLQKLKERSSLSLRAIAREMGYSQASSIQRYFSSDYPETGLPANFISKLLAVLPGRGDPAITREEVLALADGSVAEIQRKTPDLPKTGVPIVGEVAAGLWMEAALFETENALESTISYDIRFPAQSQFVVRVRGESLNRIAGNGDLLLCVDYLAAGIELKENDLVLVERSRDNGMTIERTAKRLVSLNGQSELMPESDDPRFQDTIFYREGDVDHTEVKIKAKIVMVFKPL
ncbi:SOS-response transcriptional repressor LexA [Labrenzia sp. EL_142]|nr:SOS-response transcriptional repressor LexA [Labrenzia sp. EL_142]